MTVWAAAVARSAAEVASSAAPSLDILSPIVSTGVVGAVLLMVLLRFKLMPTWVYDEREKAHQREIEAKDALLAEKNAEIAELKSTVRDFSSVYQDTVIPLLTRVYDVLDAGAEHDKAADG